MSRRGEITIECDNADCHAEQVFDTADLADTRSLDALVADAGWKFTETGDICPQCVEDGKA